MDRLWDEGITLEYRLSSTRLSLSRENIPYWIWNDVVVWEGRLHSCWLSNRGLAEEPERGYKEPAVVSSWQPTRKQGPWSNSLMELNSANNVQEHGNGFSPRAFEGSEAGTKPQFQLCGVSSRKQAMPTGPLTYETVNILFFFCTWYACLYMHKFTCMSLWVYRSQRLTLVLPTDLFCQPQTCYFFKKFVLFPCVYAYTSVGVCQG